MKKVALCAIAGSFLVLVTAANAQSAYDGSWNLVFVTRSVHAMQPTISRSISRTGSHASQPR
jgi:hypothetical protein